MIRRHPSQELQSRDDRQFRRGAVMGLTFAEIFLLLCFVLLLLLGLLLMQRPDGAAPQFADLDAAEIAKLRRARDEGWLDVVDQARRHELTPEKLERVLRRAPQEIPADWQRLVRGDPPDARRTAPETDPDRLVDAIKAASASERAALAKLIVARAYPDVIDLARISDQIRQSALPAETVERMIEILKEPRRLGAMLADEISERVGPEIAALGGTIDRETGSVTLDDAVLFDQGKPNLNAKAQTFLSGFCKPWLMAINKFRDGVSDILIEGHASSEWAPGTTAKEAFVNNLRLSQARSAAVLAFCLDHLETGEVADWARGHLVAVGHSSARPIIADGIEDVVRSRRVVFGVRTNVERALHERSMPESMVSGEKP